MEIENTVSANGLRLTPSVKYTVVASIANCPQISVSMANPHDFQHNFSSKFTRKTPIFTSRLYDLSATTVSNSPVRVKSEDERKNSQLEILFSLRESSFDRNETAAPIHLRSVSLFTLLHRQ